MSNDHSPSRDFLPDVTDWFTDEKISKFRGEISSSLPILQWSGLLRKFALNWIRMEIVAEEISSTFPSSYNDEAQNIMINWSRKRWESTLESKYLASKHLLDKVSYSLIRVSDQNLAFELYHRIKSNEATFEELSWKYGEGSERLRGGVILNERVGESPSAFHTLFRKIYPGEILKPHRLGKWFVILSLQQLNAAQLDEETQSLLLRRDLDRWLTTAVDFVCDSLKLND